MLVKNNNHAETRHVHWRNLGRTMRVCLFFTVLALSGPALAADLTPEECEDLKGYMVMTATINQARAKADLMIIRHKSTLAKLEIFSDAETKAEVREFQTMLDANIGDKVAKFEVPVFLAAHKVWQTHCP